MKPVARLLHNLPVKSVGPVNQFDRDLLPYLPARPQSMHPAPYHVRISQRYASYTFCCEVHDFSEDRRRPHAHANCRCRLCRMIYNAKTFDSDKLRSYKTRTMEVVIEHCSLTTKYVSSQLTLVYPHDVQDTSNCVTLEYIYTRDSYVSSTRSAY